MAIEKDIPVGDISTHKLVGENKVKDGEVIVARPGQEYIHTTPKHYGSDKKRRTQNTVPGNKFYVEEIKPV